MNMRLQIVRATALAMLPVVLLLSQCAHAQKRHSIYARQYHAFALKKVTSVEAKLPEITRVAELMAKRHLAGGAIGFVNDYHEGSGLHAELEGRSGGLVNIGFDRVWTKERTEQQKANDMAIAAWDNGPWPGDLEKLGKLRAAGVFIIGFGPRGMTGMAERAALTDAWFDTDLGDPWSPANAHQRAAEATMDADGVETFLFMHGGRGRLLMNMLHSWSLVAEFVAALTRQGKMPTMWKSYMYPDGVKWGDKYFQKLQFHDDYKIAPIPAGKLTKAYLDELARNIRWFSDTQDKAVAKAARMIAVEAIAGRQTVVATEGHAPPTYAGVYEDKVWAKGMEVYDDAAYLEPYAKGTADNALVLRLGYTGVGKQEMETFAKKKQRVIYVTTQNPSEDRKIPTDLPVLIDMGWTYGDAAVAIEGYPIKILPPSGIIQLIAYESINLQVMAILVLNPGIRPVPDLLKPAAQ